MTKNNKKLLIFWIIAVIFLSIWSFYWLRINNKNVDEKETSFSQKIDEAKVVYSIWSRISQKDNKEKTFLLLFQNDMELRPGGGYIGTFGILKIKNGDEIAFGAHNTNAFDERINENIPVPYPMKETLHITELEMRDSNWFPDFKDNALKAEEFYKLGQGEENFDGIIAINSNVLTSFLKITGPIEIPGVEESFTENNTILKLEYLVEKGYEENGIDQKERKQVISDLAKAILEKAKGLNFSQKLELLKLIEKDLNNKNIQLFFRDSELQNQVEDQNWGGRVNGNWQKDYLMLVDANLSSLKTNRVVDYSIDYTLDLSQEKPQANLDITITNNGQEKDWLTKDYQSFLRVYLPQSAWLLNPQDFKGIKFQEEYGKKSIGFIAQVPLKESRTFKLTYTLSNDFKKMPYEILIQKQSGIKNIPIKLTLKKENGEIESRDLLLEKDKLD